MMIALTPRIPICRTAQYFNPHFRKGSDRWGMMRKRYLQISIHTSAREVTNEDIRQAIRFIISIHTSAREVTKAGTKVLPIVIISIHTSAREVTDRLSANSSMERFQSTLPQGKWLYEYFHFCSKMLFQSTLPQGKWRVTEMWNRNKYKFQSTLPQGKWRRSWGDDWKARQFQSTLPQGKWLHGAAVNGYDAYFSPHFRKGSDIAYKI